MTPRAFCQPDRANALKGAIHGVMLVGAALCCGYNVAAFWYRRQPHNAVNAIIYGALVALEYQHVTHHADTAA